MLDELISGFGVTVRTEYSEVGVGTITGVVQAKIAMISTSQGLIFSDMVALYPRYTNHVNAVLKGCIIYP